MIPKGIFFGNLNRFVVSSRHIYTGPEVLYVKVIYYRKISIEHPEWMAKEVVNSANFEGNR